MPTKYLKCLGVLLLLIIGITALSTRMSVRTTKSQTADTPSERERVIAFNRKALLARTGDEQAVGDFADEVFSQFAPPEASDALPLFKDRVVRAEVNYRRTGKGGVKERDMAGALNGLAKQMGAPDYAKVNVRQVRFLRLNAMSVLPGLVTQPKGGQSKKSVIDSEMSPLEAVGMALFMGNQKLTNEDFQVPPAEWEAKRHQKEVAKWEAYKKGLGPLDDKRSEIIPADGNSRSRKLKGLAFQHRNDALNLVNESLDRLGIPR